MQKFVCIDAFSRPLHQRYSGTVSPTGMASLKQVGYTDPYYRKPRKSRIDILSGTAGKHSSLISEDASKQASDPQKLEQVPQVDAGEGASISRKGTPVPTHVRSGKNEINDVANELTRTKTDYVVRES